MQEGDFTTARIRELEQRLNTARVAYYNQHPVISDDEYDALSDELLELQGDNPAVTAVGASPGESSWQKVAHTIPMGSKLRTATLTQLQDIPGMGPKRAQSLVGWLRRSSSVLDDFVKAGVQIKAKVSGGLSGKSFCFTGKMTNKRPTLEKMAKDAGGVVKDRVGQGLTYLVISDPNSTSAKAQAARENGTTCISEEEFLVMVGRG